jgi:DNA-binding LytR/AlgR family response regulator
LQSSQPDEVLSYVQANKVDVLILDINLKSAMNGCDIAEKIRKTNKELYIIFTTAHLEYVLIAYKYKTFDYLPKPVLPERLEETILRLLEDMKKSPQKFLRLNNNKTIINQDEIDYIKRNGMKLVICTKSREYEVYSSFNKIQACLPDNFVRCHKSFVANVNNIKDVETSKNKIKFNDSLHCFIGEKYKNNFMEVLNHGNFSKTLDSTYDPKRSIN